MSSHETAHHDHHAGEKTSRTAFASSFWFVVILVGLFIAALNFISAMGGGDEHGSGHGTEHAGGHATMPTREATSNSTLHGETGVGRPAADTTQHFDTVLHDGRADQGNQ